MNMPKSFTPSKLNTFFEAVIFLGTMIAAIYFSSSFILFENTHDGISSLLIYGSLVVYVLWKGKMSQSELDSLRFQTDCASYEHLVHQNKEILNKVRSLEAELNTTNRALTTIIGDVKTADV